MAGSSVSKIALSTKELEELVRSIDRCPPGTAEVLGDEWLAGVELDHLVRRLGPLLSLPIPIARSLATAFLEERRRPAGPRVELVWTGPEAINGNARDTAVVVRELFSRARSSVLIAGYSFDHGADIFAPLYAAMQQWQVEVHLFADIPGADRSESAHQFVRRWADAFFRTNWQFPLRPKVFFDPRAVERESYASLHAKCVVVDQRLALVTSANFTNRGHDRNVEVGVLIDDPFFASSLVAQWRSAVAAGVFREIEKYLDGDR
jgi:phosphatidylserine/phosphatidylglycerophosphate/cardiolipin synthase-like enzyme